MYRKEDLKKDLQKYAYYDKNCEKKALSLNYSRNSI